MVSILLPVVPESAVPPSPSEEMTQKIGPVFKGLSRDHFNIMLKYYLDCCTYEGNNWKWIIRNRVVYTDTHLFPCVKEWLDSWEKCVVRIENEEYLSFGVEYSADTTICESEDGYLVNIEETSGTVYSCTFDDYELDQFMSIISNTAIYSQSGEMIRP